VFAGIGAAEPGPRGDVLPGLRDQHVACLGRRRDPSADVDGPPPLRIGW